MPANERDARSRHILVLTPSLSHGNGIGEFSAQVLHGLTRVASTDRRTVIVLTSGEAEPIPGWRVIGADTKLDFAARALGIAAARRPTDLVIMHLAFAPLGLLAARLAGSRTVLTTYGREVWSNRSRIERSSARHMDQLVAISRRTALDVDALLHRRASAASISVLHPTWNHDRSTTDQRRRARMREAYGLGDAEIVLLTVGRLDSRERYKGHDRVMRVLPTLCEQRPVRYLIVGDGDDQPRLAAIAEDLGLADIVTFAGYVDDIRDAYAACDVFVMPSTGEGFGIVFLEALASGRPIVLGGTDGSIDAADWGELGFVCDPFSPPSLANAIRRAIGAIDGQDRRGDPEFLITGVNDAFGYANFDARLGELFPPR